MPPGASTTHARIAVLPGEHNLETVQAHLPQMLSFAGRALAEASPKGGGAGHAPS